MNKIVLLLCVSLFSFSSVFATDNSILGVWTNDKKNIRIETFMVGENLFGKIVWLKEPTGNDGKPKTDVNNPKAELQKRPLIGLNMLLGYTYDDGKWEDGKIYNLKNGSVYDSYIEMKSKDELLLTGYIGAKWLGQTVVWTRVEP